MSESSPEVPVDWRNSYDWSEAFSYAHGNLVPGATCAAGAFAIEDVVSVVAMENGENDEANWIMVALLRDGRFAFVSAGCDNTGWDCQAGGDGVVSHSVDHLWQFGVDEDSRSRLRDQVSGNDLTKSIELALPGVGATAWSDGETHYLAVPGEPLCSVTLSGSPRDVADALLVQRDAELERRQ